MKRVLVFGFTLLMAYVHVNAQHGPIPYHTDRTSHYEYVDLEEFYSRLSLHSGDELSLVQVNTLGAGFHKTWLMDDSGTAISRGFAPTAFFTPNNNTVIVNGTSHVLRDSFNPYGSANLGQALVVGAINKFITAWGQMKKDR